MQPSQWINAFLSVAAAFVVVVIVKELKSSIRSQHYYYCDYSTQFAFLIRQTVPGKKKKSRKMGLRRNRNNELGEHSLPDHYPVTHFREIF